MQVTINVTQEDIDKGVRGEAARCPVMLAVLRAVPDVVGGSVWTKILVELAGDTKWLRSETPDDVFKRIKKYDDGGKMKPFSFEVNLEVACG